VAIVLDQRTTVAAAPAKVFQYLHDPAARGSWDAVVDLCRLEGDRPAVGARLHLRGRRTAPSWVGEYVVFEPPSRSELRLVEGVGMPFRNFSQTIEVRRSDGGSEVLLRTAYEPVGPARLLEPVVLRPRLRRAALRSLANVSSRFL
jgi:uncharacterized protein YndB with AHSA1/START domain